MLILYTMDYDSCSSFGSSSGQVILSWIYRLSFSCRLHTSTIYLLYYACLPPSRFVLGYGAQLCSNFGKLHIVLIPPVPVYQIGLGFACLDRLGIVVLIDAACALEWTTP